MALRLFKELTVMPMPSPLPTLEPDLSSCLRQVLDLIDYGVIVSDADLRVLHLNRRACADLGGEHPILIAGDRVCVRKAAEQKALRKATSDAAEKGMRAMCRLTWRETEVLASVVPLSANQSYGPALVLLGRRDTCLDLSLDGYARCYGLSDAEASVLARLADGLRADEIAQTKRVALSTVRSQLASIRAKTGLSSLQSLVRELGKLPPLMPLLDANTDRFDRRP